MEQTGGEKTTGVVDRPNPHPQAGGRSQHHVEGVIARILAKRQASTKQPPFRYVDMQDKDKGSRR